MQLCGKSKLKLLPLEANISNKKEEKK